MRNLINSIKASFTDGLMVALGLLAFLGVLVTYASLRALNSSKGLWVVLVGILLIIPFAVALIIQKLKWAHERKSNALKLDNFKKEALKYKVDLSKAKVKTNSFTVEKEIVSRQAGLDYMIGESERNIRKSNHHLNIIIVPIDINGSTRYISYECDMDTEKLKWYFAFHSETYFYVNPKDSNDYYLDLEFMNP